MYDTFTFIRWVALATRIKFYFTMAGRPDLKVEVVIPFTTTPYDTVCIKGECLAFFKALQGKAEAGFTELDDLVDRKIRGKLVTRHLKKFDRYTIADPL